MYKDGRDNKRHKRRNRRIKLALQTGVTSPVIDNEPDCII